MDLLEIFTRAGIAVSSLDVFLIQLTACGVRQRNTKLKELRQQLGNAGVTITRNPRARTSKETPCDGFALPASFVLSVPAVIAEEVAAALWKCVW